MYVTTRTVSPELRHDSFVTYTTTASGISPVHLYYVRHGIYWMGETNLTKIAIVFSFIFMISGLSFMVIMVTK